MNARFDVTCVELTTPHLVLRPWRQTDLNDFFAYASVDGVGQLAGWAPHESKEKSQAILNNFIKEKKVFAIYHKEDKKVIGSLGVEKYSEKMKEFDHLEGRELGFVLSKDYWGRGLMAEAVNAVINYCFNTLRYDFLLCCHFERNLQSKRVQEKCGFEPYRMFVYETLMGTKEDAIANVLFNPKNKVQFTPGHPETLLYKPFVKSPEQMWNDFCEKSGLDKSTSYEAWDFGCSPNKLAGLVLKGEKKATTSAYEEYELEGESIPKVGEYSIILNAAGYAVCVIKDTQVEIKKFSEVDADFAFAEGEGDKSLKYWRDVHIEFLTSRGFSKDSLVVCERFEVVYK